MAEFTDIEYPKDSNYNNIFNEYPFELSSFQKYAIEAIIEGEHILVTAHTGSGKTLPAEFAIKHFIKQGKKIIYTSPIKALSNQKFYEFQRQFPDITFGLLTGDIKSNPEADVLIMTTEILRNTLFQKKVMHEENREKSENMLNFDMDIENELGCVVFDEIHYINDADRGKVWEETIMMLPNHIQMVMLSATLDRPENFASWIETNKGKMVKISSTTHRVVPLKHYLYVTMHDSAIKKIDDIPKQDDYYETTRRPILLKDKEFSNKNFKRAKEIITHIKYNNQIIKRSYVLNNIVRYLNTNGMLPAICFVFSRKGVEQCAAEISVGLFEPDDVTPSIIENECKQILMKLPNYKEYLYLPEYTQLMSLFKKGIAIHHSGIMPIFREMVELMFAKNYIKLLFATETFAVGINMPTKTVLFTSLNKYDGSYNRMLYSHEYTQMAGRAGRRGLDKIGHVIHLNNLFDMPTDTDYKNMLSGKPQSLTSKFKIHYNLILNLISVGGITPSTSEGENKLTSFIDRSMIQKEIDKEYNNTKKQYDDVLDKFNKSNELMKELKTPLNVLTEYMDKVSSALKLKNKQKKRMEREIKDMETPVLLADIELYKQNREFKHSVDRLVSTLKNIETYTEVTVNMLIEILINNNYVEKDGEKIKIKDKGVDATQIQEWHCLAASELLEDTNYLDDYSPEDICALFSCFTNLVIQDSDKLNYINFPENNLKKLLALNEKKYNKYFDIEMRYQLDTGYEFTQHWDLVGPVLDWCKAENEQQCKLVLQNLAKKNVFTGEFIKALLKINNAATELEKICELTNRMDLLKKLKEIPEKTLKFIATNQSLYV